MIENIGRKLTLSVILLVVSLGLLILPDDPFRLGLDLQGGTRLVYSFDLDRARGDGLIGDDETNAEVLRQQIDIIRERVDPTGVLDPIIRSEGADRVVIELPGTAGTGSRPTAALDEPLLAGARQLVLNENNPAYKEFTQDGGDVEVGSERIRYTERVGTTLDGLERGRENTAAVDHAAGEEVVLLSGDPIRNRIESLGDLSFMILAQSTDLADTDLVTERKRLTDWLDANPGKRVEDFNFEKRENGGPHPRLSWYPVRQERSVAETPERDRATACLRQAEKEEWRFRGDALGKVFASIDEFGYPCVGFEMKATRRGQFSDFTGNYVQRSMAIILNGTIYSYPTLQERLSGSSRITGRFSVDEVQELVTVLRTGSLRIKPTLENSESVGPTLGADYARRGLLSGIISLLAVLGFMIYYYRRLGIYSAVALGSTLLMLMGGMAFLQATLTLPGIAGIILTVGMAVDANILIFDRLREEVDKGRNVKQAARNGFQNALSAILDANITTLITTILLYKFGTGPVRGFAVTLSIGVVTSVFSALVITRLLVHYTLERGTKVFPMGSWLATANYKFLDKTRYAIAGSSIAIVAGVALFLALDDNRKLGIDFVGGASMQVLTEEPQPTDTIRELVATAEAKSDIRRSIEIKPVIDRATGDGRYDAFRITYKTGGNDELEAGDERFQTDILKALSGYIQRGPVDVSVTVGDGGARANIVLYMEDAHPDAEIAARLAVAGMHDVQVTPDAARPGVYSATALVDSGLGQLVLESQVKSAFQGQSDSRGVAFRLEDPVRESSTVGRQVVGELRDKAILALVLSLFATVMYLRVRFAEYSYGIAAVVAVAHDVLTTLGMLSIFMLTDFIDVEISLPMLAAFLTIIGYSLNDTIIIFDRVRENLPRMKASFAEIVDTSINQTLSRTIMTSLTTFMAVAVLFAFNVGTGNVLEGFSLAMGFGLVTGTYSTIYIACPILVFLETRSSGNKSDRTKTAALLPERPSKAVV